MQARLAVITSRARIVRGQGTQEILKAQAADILVADQLEIVRFSGQSEQSHSLLQFPNLANIEIFGNTRLDLADARQVVEGPAEVTLDFTNGHLFVHLSEEQPIQLTLRTPHATITAATAGAEFDVCHTEELTCVMVKRGIVEIEALGKREVVRAGSAGVVLNEEAPSPVVCAPVPAFVTWEQGFRISLDAPSLHEEIARLPQRACPVDADGFPLNARILYEDEFNGDSEEEEQEWEQGQFDPFTVGYVRFDGERYYQVQAKGTPGQYLAFVPQERDDEHDYEDVNIDLKTRAASASEGDFRYGVVLRRSGDRYYAFVLSPVNEAWYFLKSSANGVQLLKEGKAEGMRGLGGEDTLRIEAEGSAFVAFLNDRFIGSASDPEYASGEVGVFVESLDNPYALINFNSIVLWTIPAPVIEPRGGEKCFNAVDDDADGLIDQADSDCQRSDVFISFPTVPPLPTITPVPTNTPRPTRTPTLVPTRTPRTPTRTPTKLPTPTRPTRTPTLPPTAVPTTAVPTTIVVPTTAVPVPTATDPPVPTATDPPAPTATDPPVPTETEPEPSATEPPQATEPEPTEPPQATEPPAQP